TSSNASINVLTDNRHFILGDFGLKTWAYTSLSADQEVFIVWFGLNGVNFDWDLIITDVGSGDDCAHATPAVEGANVLSSSIKTSYWYTFTMPNETGKRLKITSTSNQQVMISTDCNDHYVTQGFSNVTANRLQPNQKVYIRWLDYNSVGHNFTWNLSIDDGGISPNCSSAVTAVEGTNNVISPVGVGGYVLWYKFTMPNATGKKLVISTSSTNYSWLYYNSCDDYYSDGNSIGLISTGPSASEELKPNQEVYIQWSSVLPNNFSWNLSVEDMVPGDKCTVPAPAIAGTNDVPALPTRAKHWYSFQMPNKAKQKLEINSLLTGNSQPFTVYTGTCNNLKFITTGTAYKMITGLSASENVFIVWGDTKDHFTWTLAVKDEEAGESCINPAKAKIGTNFSPGAPYWFTYTMPVNGNLIISSVGQTSTDTYLTVYSDCNTFLSQNDDFIALQSKLTFTGLTKGTTVLIEWRKFTPNFTSPSFNWSLAVESTETAEQVITFDEIADKTTFDHPFKISATSSSMLDVTLSTTDDEITLTGNEVTIVKPGSVTIAAKQAGFSIYLPAQVERTFCITPLKPFIKGSMTDGAQKLTSSVAANNQWFKDGVKIVGAIGVDFVPTTSGSYTVAVIIEGCSSEPSDKVDISITGVESETKSIYFYPNPFADEFTVELPSDQHASIKIMDILGRVTYQTEGIGKTQLNMGGLASGNYILKIQTDRSTMTRKLLKK
ncbi:MAG TPA: T9SS type A sorting domain-containing protein, partial [Cyclobacteriaceae bacterium]